MQDNRARRQGHGVWLCSSDNMRNRNDFWMLLVLGYLHFCLPPFIYTLRIDEFRLKIWRMEKRVKVTFLVPPGRLPGPRTPQDLLVSSRPVIIAF